MAVQYNKLWKILIDRKMSKGDLGKLAGISPNTMPILDKICETLDVDYGDIIEHVREKQIS